MIEKVICLIFDGLGDRPIREFGGLTPLEAADTPNFDLIASKSQCGMMHTLGRGVRPGSDVSHLAIFGYPKDEYYTGRGPIEVAGLGVKLEHGDVALRGNFATVADDLTIMDRRVGRIADVSDFAAAIDGIEIDGIKFIVKPGTAHRAGVIMRGDGLSAAITDSDPHIEGKKVLEIKPKDDSPEAARTAAAANEFLRISHDVLKDLDVNKQRTVMGQLAANFILIRGAGMFPHMPSFCDRYGLSACCIAGGGLYKGIGAFLGMDLIDVPGATAKPDTDVKAKFEATLDALKKYDFVFTHVKATDSLAEDGNPEGKRAFIARADEAAEILTKLKDNVLLVITADHSTACELKAHSGDPVPVVFFNPSVRIDDVDKWSERACAKGGLGFIEGKDVMPQILNLMGRLPLIGA